jgi:hypothetical protein
MVTIYPSIEVDGGRAEDFSKVKCLEPWIIGTPMSRTPIDQSNSAAAPAAFKTGSYDTSCFPGWMSTEVSGHLSRGYKAGDKDGDRQDAMKGFGKVSNGKRKSS